MGKGYIYHSPIGRFRIVEGQQGICEVAFYSGDTDITGEATPLIEKTIQQLQEYFLGQRKIFDIPLDMRGTSFQIKTWQALLQIPYGETWSYKQLALTIGNKNASRAVGNANNKNPLAIIVPCHRVIGSNGELVGYAGGLEKKEYLLELERKYRQ